MFKACILAMTAATAAAALSRGHVIAHKALSAPDSKDILVQGRPFTVTYSLVNAGEQSVHDVVVRDGFPETDFDVVSGSQTMRFATLEAGANETAVLVVVPKVSGVMNVARAEVDYKYRSVDEEDEESEEAGGEVVPATTYTSTPGRVEIVRPEVYERLSASHTFQIVLVFLAAAALIAGPWYKYQEAKEANAAPAVVVPALKGASKAGAAKAGSSAGQRPSSKASA